MMIYFWTVFSNVLFFTVYSESCKIRNNVLTRF